MTVCPICGNAIFSVRMEGEQVFETCTCCSEVFVGWKTVEGEWDRVNYPPPPRLLP